MYCTGMTIVYKASNPEIHALLSDFAHKAKCLSNAALFRIRQYFSSKGKDVLSTNEQQVLDEIELTVKATGLKQPKSTLSYVFLEKLMRVTRNPDFFAGLPMQTAQSLLKERISNMKAFFEALKTYKENPSAFTGKPRLPKYIQGDMHSFKITNQDCVLLQKDGHSYLKLPFIKQRLEIQPLPDKTWLKEVTACPYYGEFQIFYTYQTDDVDCNTCLTNSAAVDFGVDNAAAIVTSEGYSLLVKGEFIKSINQKFNKQRSKLVSIATMGHKTVAAPETKAITALSRNRDLFIRDAYHQISKRIVDFCLYHNVGTLYLGLNKNWKQNSNIGKINNQNFCELPISKLQSMIKYKAENKGIVVVVQEESYTSKASFLDGDFIPVYGTEDNENEFSFSGRRVCRGLYKSANGTVLNADINAAANILRKSGSATDNVNVKMLQNPIVLHFKDLHSNVTVIA